MERKKSGFQIMKRLVKELKPLAPIMVITITMGVLGFLASIAIGSFAVLALGAYHDEVLFISFKGAMIVMAVCALIRGFLRYGEQLSGHYIAFKILYILRDKMFTKLRKLAPAKLDGKEKGNLISLITSDIELLEVFYAHTIAPISIAILTNSIIAIVLGIINPWFGILGAVYFIIVGVIIPIASSKMAKDAGASYRNMFGKSNNYILDSLRGLKEILQFKNGEERIKQINENSEKLNESLDQIKDHEGFIRAVTDLTIMLAILTMTAVGFLLFVNDKINFTQMLLGIVIIASSFGPVVALSNLSNTLLQTFACAERLFTILDEEPQVEEVLEGKKISGESISYNDVTFSYEGRENPIFEDASVDIKKGDKIALIGESGIGKSTFIKLMMRFFDVNKGTIKFDNNDIKEIQTDSLRDNETLVSQETYLFNESIEDNIKIGNKDATREEVIAAAKKASIHEFIETLPKGYETKAGELGSSLSSGEKQRIGLARAFVSSGDILILDEPTSNLDTLNEGEILRSIKENCEDKTIVLISHRKSTTAVCNRVLKLEKGKLVEE